jgi:D-alanyl-D-alanine carboxypeptidase
MSRPSSSAVWFLLASALVACGGGDGGSGAGAAPAPSSTTTSDPGGPPPPPDPAQQACDAETVKLKAGVDKAHVKTTGAVLAVKTPSCGLRVLTSGPSSLTDKQLHRIGSVTKTYVAAVVMSFVKEGALSLEDPLSKFDLGVPNGENITLRQTLSHTSGIYSYTDDTDFLKEALTTQKVYAPSDLVAVATKHAPYFAPGAGWHYSNTNYILLGMIAEKTGKAKIGALVRQRVLSKIGVTATFFEGEEPISGELATGLATSGADMTRAYGPSWAWAAGAMVARPDDVVTWIEKLGGGTFHDPAIQKEILTTVPTDAGALRYGLGIMVLDKAASGGFGPGIGHGGDIPGYHTQAFYFPDKQTTIVSIVDSDAEDPNAVTVAALDVLRGKK